ncbi:hypothetical protein [Sphingomonas oryzagri]
MATDTTTETDTSTEDTSGLKNKNADLVKRLKAAEKRAEDAERAAEEAADNAKAETGSELDKANRAITKLQKDLDAANLRADDSDKSYRNYRATAAINEAIANNNVDSKHSAMLAKAFRGDIEFSDEGEPTIDGKAVDVYFKSYFSKEGLSYVRADQNGGGASQGYEGGKAAAWNKLPSTNQEWAEFDKMPVAERNAVCDQLNAPHLKL